jgi:acyl carrier protein
MSDTKTRLREVLVQSLDLKIDPSEVPDNNVVAGLGLDSINTIEFLIWVEGEFNVQIADEDLSIELIDDMDKLAEYVDARRDQPSRTG